MTAITEMIETLEQNPNEFINKEDTINLLKKVGLEKERQQIIDASNKAYEHFNLGYLANTVSRNMGDLTYGEQYYNSTFNNI